MTPVRTGPWPTTSGPSPSISVAWPTRTPVTSVIASCAPGSRRPMRMPSSRAGTFPPIRSMRRRLRTAPISSPRVQLAGGPSHSAAAPPRTWSMLRVAGARPRRADGRRRGVPRPAGPRAARERATGPDRPLELPDRRPGGGRGRAVRRSRPVRRGEVDAGAAGRRRRGRTSPTATAPAVPPFAGGLVGFLGYDLGRRFERLPSIARVDQHLPVLRLALHDWALAWDRRTGEAWLAARAVDGDARRLDRRARGGRARGSRRSCAARSPAAAGRRAARPTVVRAR